MNLSSGHYYEYLFSCILFSVLGEQFKKADINTDITEHYDAIICGTPCDFTMQLSEKSKMTYKNIILIRFPHKSYHKGGRVKKEIVNIILNTVRDHDIPIEPDDNRLASLNKRIAKYAY